MRDYLAIMQAGAKREVKRGTSPSGQGLPAGMGDEKLKKTSPTPKNALTNQSRGTTSLYISLPFPISIRREKVPLFGPASWGEVPELTSLAGIRQLSCDKASKCVKITLPLVLALLRVFCLTEPRLCFFLLSEDTELLRVVGVLPGPWWARYKTRLRGRSLD